MAAAEIRTVRRFNRSLTKRIGALNESFLGAGRPLGQARLLFEIGTDGEDLKTLRERLGLDSGYLSRLVQALEKDGLITVHAPRTDGRLRHAALTEAGRREVARYERASDSFVAGLVDPLTPGQRAALTQAMATVERLLDAGAVTIAREAPDGLDAERCFRAYFAELDRRFAAGFDAAASNPAEAADLVAPNGVLAIARLDGRPVGCGALKATGAGFGEIKRMWVSPPLRGAGVGARLLRFLEDEAGALGLRGLRLETNRALTEARALYAAAGYREVPAFNREPYADHWFEKTLADQPA